MAESAPQFLPFSTRNLVNDTKLTEEERCKGPRAVSSVASGAGIVAA